MNQHNCMPLNNLRKRLGSYAGKEAFEAVPQTLLGSIMSPALAPGATEGRLTRVPLKTQDQCRDLRIATLATSSGKPR